MNKQIVSPGPSNTLLDEYGNTITPPQGWIFLPAGDSAITRKVTARGKYWKVAYKKGRRVISKGVWAPKDIIEQASKEVFATRNTESYKKKRVADLQRREKKQEEYEGEFMTTVRRFLNFAPIYKDVEKIMAFAISKHATPVGSGTVARTTKLTISEKASRATIAWMRHQTTAYDSMKIPNIKGARREVRRMLAQRSSDLLMDYRQGKPIKNNCPLKIAIERIVRSG